MTFTRRKKKIRNPKSEKKTDSSSFGFRIFFLRISTFLIPHSDS